MASDNPVSSALVEEAQSVETSPDRLQDLLRLEPALGATIASNPSAPPKLLDQLALNHPAEVLANPSLPLQIIEGDGVYSAFSLPSLMSLCLACDPEQHADLREETKERISAGIEELREQKEASLSCEWLYEPAFTLRPEDCGSLIPHALDFTLRVRVHIESEGSISIDSEIPDLEIAGSCASGEQRDQLARFLETAATGSLHEYINDDELTREDTGNSNAVLKYAVLPEGFSIDGLTLYRDQGDHRGCERILDFSYDYDFRADSPVKLVDGTDTVSVEWIDEVSHKYEIAMGELSSLKVLHNKKRHCLPADWSARLAALLIP